MLRSCFLDFAVEHWFGCRAAEPGFSGDIGALEVWLIDWLIDSWTIDYQKNLKEYEPCCRNDFNHFWTTLTKLRVEEAEKNEEWNEIETSSTDIVKMTTKNEQEDKDKYCWGREGKKKKKKKK